MQPPDKIIERSGIKPGMTVLDLGCGSGAFTIPVARAVGEQGKVIAVDIQRAMLRQLKRKLAKAKNHDIKNIEVRHDSAYNLPMADGTVDLALMVTSLPEMAERERALREVRRVLKPGGILAVSEMIIDPDFPWRSTTIKLCEGEGFVVEESLGKWWSYTVRFRRK
ncbi:MAG: class I SAM-dependent methyltransferase [Chloroflexi bacterium]|nr:class I SAM-dependent methyltransferase [Chloroflexota bacterium]